MIPIRVMLDLETLGTDNNASLLSIGAVRFDEAGQYEEFYTAVRPDKQIGKWGRSPQPESNKKWWSEQSAAAQAVLFDCLMAPYLDQALFQFTKFVSEVAGAQPALTATARTGDNPVFKGVELWGNGSDFDNIILGNAYEGCGLAKPWSYSNNRCYRTLKNLGISLGAGDGTDRGKLVAHNALDDAKYQAHYASQYLRILKEMNVALEIERKTGR